VGQRYVPWKLEEGVVKDEVILSDETSV